MNYLYHRVPENMEGDILYPLNDLKDIYPEIYEEGIGKYEDREFVMDYKIPYLNCLWNDVLHFTAVNPRDTLEALSEARGRDYSTKKFYKVNPELLDPEKTVVYLYKQKDRSEKMSKDNFERYNPDDIDKLSKLPKETKEYYRQMFKDGKRPLMYVRVPHILYKGSLNTAKLPIIEV